MQTYQKVVFIKEAITEDVANNMIALTLHLDSLDQKRIYYWMNCPGGEVVPTLALYDTMQYVRSKTATVCYGLCLGMGGFLLTTGGEKVSEAQRAFARARAGARATAQRPRLVHELQRKHVACQGSWVAEWHGCTASACACAPRWQQRVRGPSHQVSAPLPPPPPLLLHDTTTSVRAWMLACTRTRTCLQPPLCKALAAC